MRQKCALVSVLLAVLVLISCRGEHGDHGTQPDHIKVIGLTQIASHPSLDSVREGIISGLAKHGWHSGKNLRVIFKNANRDPSLPLPIAQSFLAEDVDVIVPITTPSALAASQATKSIPIVFAGVTDPVGSGLITDLAHPGGNVTGTSDRWPFRDQLELFRAILPGLRRLGVLYSPGDNVSAIAIKELRTVAPAQGISLSAVPISNAQDLYSAARQLLFRTDALYTGLDNLIVENVESLLKAADEAHKPVFAGDEGTVKRGAVATYGIDMRELGFVTSNIIDRVLRGEKPGNIPVVTVRRGRPIIVGRL